MAGIFWILAILTFAGGVPVLLSIANGRGWPVARFLRRHAIVIGVVGAALWGGALLQLLLGEPDPPVNVVVVASAVTYLVAVAVYVARESEGG